MRLLGIDVAPDEVRIADGESRLGRVRLLGTRRIPLGDDGLAPLLARLGAGRRAHVLTALPATAVAHRILTLPFRDPRRLARTVPLELAGQLAAEVEDAVVAFAPLAEDAAGTTVLAVAARGADVGERTAVLAAAGLTAARIDLAPLPVWNLVAAGVDDAALVLADGTQSAVALRRHGRLVALRALGASARVAAAFAAEVRWTLAALGELPPVAILAGADAGPMLAETLASAAGVRVVPLADVAAAGGHDLAACAVAAGLVVGAGGRSASGIHLAGSAAAAGSWRPAGALAAAAVVLAAVNLGLWRARLEQRDGALRAAIHAAAAAALPDSLLAAPRAELEAAVAALDRGGAHAEAAGALALLRDASARVPASIQLDLDQLVVEPGTLRLGGRAASFDAVEALRRALAASPLLGEVAAEEARSTVDGHGVEFRLRAARRSGAGTSS